MHFWIAHNVWNANQPQDAKFFHFQLCKTFLYFSPIEAYPTESATLHSVLHGKGADKWPLIWWPLDKWLPATRQVATDKDWPPVT